MRTGKISKSDAWVALTSTIWSTLMYPPPALNLTKKQCEFIMSPILNYALPAVGICRSFPRTIVFSPIKYLGLGIKHLYTLQEISRIKYILLHTYRDISEYHRKLTARTRNDRFSALCIFPYILPFGHQFTIQEHMGILVRE